MAESKARDINPKHKRLRDFLEYNPESGEFKWLQKTSRKVKGQRAGYNHRAGYWEIMVQHERYLAHRLAWFFVHGEWPDKFIDHKNGDGRDNRIENLRLATYPQNLANSKRASSNTSGFKGVSLDKRRGTWQVYIKKNNVRKYLGAFGTPQEAHEAYKTATITLNGEFARWV